MGLVHAKTDAKQVEKEEISLNGVGARVDKIHVNGLGRTKDDIVKRSVQELFRAEDFQEVILSAHRAKQRLENLGCFKNIGVFIDTSSGPNATPEGLDVTFYVKELKVVTGGIHTTVGNNEGSLVIGVKFPNIFGRGERVQTEYSYGSKKSNNFHVQFIKPFHESQISSSIYQTMSEWPWSGYKLVDRGLMLEYAFKSLPFLQHSVQWDGAVRDLSVLSRSTSFAVREHCGLNLKSSLRHVLTLDKRDDLVFPTTGYLFKVSSELAGFGGDVGFLKNEVNVQTNFSLFDDAVLQTSFQAGYMRQIFQEKKLHLADQFFLGGPLSIRGFEMRGIGPRTDGDALGSDVFVAGGLHLFAPLPFRPGRSSFGDLFRIHAFLNAGNVAQAITSDPVATIDSLKENFRVSYGFGLAVRIGHNARLEINYCIPYKFQRSDNTHPGVQFGIGMQFL